MSTADQRGAHLLSAELMRMVNLDPKAETKEVLVQYLVSEPGTIELTPKQQEMLERAEEADRLMRKGDYTRMEMEQMLADKFGYSLNTARNDLYLAEHIWGNAHKRNKSYLMSGHIDLIDRLLIAAEQRKDWKNVNFLLAERTRAIKELPERSEGDTTPAAIIFNFGTGTMAEMLGEDMSLEEAHKAASEYLGKDIEDIDHEMIDEQ